MLTRVPSPTDLELWCKLTGVDSPEPDESGNGYSGVLTGTVQDADPGLILLGDTGIASEEALGTGSVAHVSADKAITGVAGIASGESFDVGIIYQQLIEGVTSISSQEAFDIGVVRLYQTITGVAGIASEETLDLGVLVGPITGVAGIISAEAFEVTGSISNNTIIGAGFSIVSLEAFDIGGLNFEGGPIAGVTGIPSGEDFPLGIVAGPILGVSGIASEGAMGLGSLAQVGILLTRPNGIASLEFFDKLGVLSGGPVGYLGIASAEKFGPGTVMRWDAEFLANSNYVVYVDGQPINDYLRESSISGDLQINFNGSCSFQTIDRTGAWEPEIGQEIVIMRYIAATDTWDRAFGGSVQNVQITRNPGDTTTFHDVSGVDYGHFAGRRVLNMKFDKEQYGTLTSILEFINATILEQEGITWVNRGDPGTVIDTIEFNYIYLNQVFDQLKEITGWDWATDRWRNFYMYNRPAEIIAAPTQIRDDTTGQYAEVHRNASVNRSRGLYRNVQHVKANIPTLGDPDGAGSGSGYYWSTAGGIVSESYTVGLNDVLRYFDGKLLEDHRYDGLVNEIISFQINGEDAVIWPVKPDGYWDAAPGGWDYRAIWPREISYIWDIVGRWDEAPGPGDTVTITFSSEAGGTAPPVISTDITDPVTINEITVRADIEPGSGVYENVYDAGTIDDPALLETIANELLSQFSEMGLEVDFETYVDGLWPGQTLRVDLPGQGVDEKDLIIEQVSFQEEQKTRLLYRVKASNKVQQRDAMAAIARLIRRINKAPKVTGNSFLFELAPSQQGFVNAGIQVGNDVTSHAQAFQNFTCSKIIVMPKNPPTGSSATINIKANGVSILQGGALDIPAGSGEFTTSAFSTGGLTLPAGATLTVDILGVGSSSPGSDISIQLVGFFG
jgi:hypothetical protein